MPATLRPAMTGLSTGEAATLLERHGPNALPEPRPEHPARLVLRQLRSPLIYLLLVAVAIDAGAWLWSGARGVPIEALVIAAILAGNALLGAWQERRAEQALAHLRVLAAPQAWVWRDGVLRRLPASGLVPDDLIRVEAGERVAADGSIQTATNLLVDESLVTGESLPVEKAAGDELLAGTLLVRGHAVAHVSRTGTHSALGAVAASLARVRPEPTPLEHRLERFGRTIGRFVIALAAVVMAAGIVAGGWQQAGAAALFAVALAVAAVPEGLPAILTFTLARGVERMAQRHAVVRRLAAVEALGSVTVIATDKTGTLTENRLEVQALESDDPDGALCAMVLASTADAGGGAGDPLELALLSFAVARGVDVAEVRGAMEHVSSRAFDSVTRFMRVSVVEAGRPVSYLKGAPELLLERAALAAPERQRWIGRVESAATQGFRTLGLARSAGEREHELEWLGFVTLWDPPRPEVAAALRRARAAGIRVIVITGDHPGTAATVAHHVGLTVGRAVSGAELERLDDAALQRAVAEATIFARMNPAHKLRIVEALQARGDVVAMTGDGVNDAPALKRADVGIAMGRRGSDVSREVADLVLLDDNFATIVHAIEEGRGILENIQKFIRFLFSTNLSEVLVVGLAALAAASLDWRDPSGALLLPLTAAQLLWINLLTDGAPALALGLDRNPGVMERRPRPPAAPLLDGPSRRFIIASGAVKAGLALLLMLLLWRLGASAAVIGTATFTFLAAGQLLFAYAARRSAGRPRANRVLHLAVAGSFALQGMLLFTPVGRAFDVAPLSAPVLILIVAAMLVSWATAELIARVAWPRVRQMV